MNAVAGKHPQTQFRHCWQCELRVNIGVVDKRRTKEHRFERTQAGKSNRFLLGHHVSLWHARRIGRGEAHVFCNTTHHTENRVRMNID